jgi:hypothetical protein
MQIFLRWVLVCAAFVLTLRADRANTVAPPEPKPLQNVTPKPKPKRLRWLRRIGSAEVGLAMKLSGIGIEHPAPATQPPPATAEGL